MKEVEIIMRNIRVYISPNFVWLRCKEASLLELKTYLGNYEKEGSSMKRDGETWLSSSILFSCVAVYRTERLPIFARVLPKTVRNQ